MAKTRLAATRTTAPKKKNNNLTKSGRPRKGSDAWLAEYWNAKYKLILDDWNNLEYHLRMAEGSHVNGKTEEVLKHIQSARMVYKQHISCGRWLMTVGEDSD